MARRGVTKRFTWCGVCRRVYTTFQWWAQDWNCPGGCGARLTQARRWEALREENADLPETPEAGARFALNAIDPPAVPALDPADPASCEETA